MDYHFDNVYILFDFDTLQSITCKNNAILVGNMTSVDYFLVMTGKLIILYDKSHISKIKCVYCKHTSKDKYCNKIEMEMGNVIKRK